MFEVLKISLSNNRVLREQSQLRYDDTSISFIRNATQLIENKYPSTNIVLNIQSSSCRLAGHLLCSHLLKMLFTLYNVEPVLPSQKTLKNETTSSKMIHNHIHANCNKNYFSSFYDEYDS